MKKNVLVLNQDYSPLTICTVERAFLLVFLQKAELLTASLSQSLRTVSKTYPMPAVVRLYNFVHLPYRGVVLSRQNIFKRDGHTCQYCGGSKDLTLDHVIPKSQRGKSTWKNLVAACKRCNARKGNFTPQQAGLSLAREPYKPSFILFLRDFSGLTRDEWKPFLKVEV